MNKLVDQITLRLMSAPKTLASFILVQKETRLLIRKYQKQHIFNPAKQQKISLGASMNTCNRLSNQYQQPNKIALKSHKRSIDVPLQRIGHINNSKNLKAHYSEFSIPFLRF